MVRERPVERARGELHMHRVDLGRTAAPVFVTETEPPTTDERSAVPVRSAISSEPPVIATVGPVWSASWRIWIRHAPTGPCEAPTNVPRVDEIGGTSVPTTRRSTFELPNAAPARARTPTVTRAASRPM